MFKSRLLVGIFYFCTMIAYNPKDWFTFIYDHCKSAYKLIQKNKMEDFDIDKGFNEIVKNIFSYKEVSLYPKLCVQMSL